MVIGAELGGAAGARAPPLLHNPRKFIVYSIYSPKFPVPALYVVHLHYLEHFGASDDNNELILQTVESEAFKGLTQVRFIFLPAGVRDLKPDAFSGLEMVDKLKLAYLDLNELVAYTFRGIKKLRSLVIENSDLATIRSKAFAGMY